MARIANSLPTISVSIVSHLQGGMIKMLLADMQKYCNDVSMEVLLTLNVAERLDIAVNDYSFPVFVHMNSAPNGFAANHNQAFMRSSGQFFCVLNPDIRLPENPFQPLLDKLQNDSVGVAAPLIAAKNGAVEDSARCFPTPFKILCKTFGRYNVSDYVIKKETIFPDWVGGMFMLFRSEVFEKLGGFDPRYFLYYEDVDICARLRLQGYEVVLCPQAKAIHDARRESHRSFKYFKWHLISMMNFFCSGVFLKIYWKKLRGDRK
jgi:N-acetylglucosaminyl-diphospho-decaprenol L-rhamnosyltransferase